MYTLTLQKITELTKRAKKLVRENEHSISESKHILEAERKRIKGRVSLSRPESRLDR